MDRRSNEDPPPPFPVSYARVWDRTALLKSKILFEFPFSPHIRISDMYSFYFSFLSLPCLTPKYQS